jgi:adenine/guanine phosphoribosyltransferase-like PRPP-binding protein
LGIELKNKEKKYFSLVKNSNNYFISTGFYQKSGLHCAYAFGLLLAYAIANQLEMGVSFALPFWKVIIDLPIEFTDLEYIID